MILWGEAIDPSKAKLYELPDKISPLPPHPSEGSGSSRTKTYPKPTAYLPADHASNPGETNMPAFPSQGDATDTELADEGYFSHITDLVRSNTWLFIAGGIVILFVVGCGVFFCRRAARRKRTAQYSAVPGDATAMSNLERGAPTTGGRSKELYDAFGVPSDDEDADEQAGLVRHEAEAYNSSYPEDAGVTPYRDTAPERREGEGSDGSGSWVHATDGRNS